MSTHKGTTNVELYKPEIDTDGVDERKLLQKMDLRIVPWLGLLYLLNFLDRGAIGNAKACTAVAALGSITYYGLLAVWPRD